jgi:heme/copper-type cytochrome/quinol oxidase subunit 4
MTTALPLLKNRVSIVWILLIIATLISWKVGTDHGGITPHLATTIVIIVAFVKVRLVGLYFMELRHAPPQLRAILEAYCLIVPTTLVIMYLAAGGP